MDHDGRPDEGPYLLDIGADPGVRVPIDRLATCRIGRSAHNDIVLTEPAASREHAAVRRDGDGVCTLVDAGSRNGTLLNGRPVKVPTRLSDGDLIAIGGTRLRFSDPDRRRMAEATPPPRGAPVEATVFIAQQSVITVLVVDIRGFTPLSTAIGEERLSAVMTAVFREAGELLHHAGCWSEKFIGDAIMAVWRQDGDRLLSSDLVRVLRTVEALHRLFGSLQARFGLPRPLAFGAAINTGPAALGNMGSGTTADFTALGDTVNKTFRLETASKDLDADLVVGEATMATLTPPLPADRLPRAAEAVLKGYAAPQPVRLLRFSEIAGFVAALTG